MTNASSALIDQTPKAPCAVQADQDSANNALREIRQLINEHIPSQAPRGTKRKRNQEPSHIHHHTIQSLSAELLAQIFDDLDVLSFFRSTLVCQYWKKVAGTLSRYPDLGSLNQMWTIRLQAADAKTRPSVHRQRIEWIAELDPRHLDYAFTLGSDKERNLAQSFVLHHPHRQTPRVWQGNFSVCKSMEPHPEGWYHLAELRNQPAEILLDGRNLSNYIPKHIPSRFTHVSMRHCALSVQTLRFPHTVKALSLAGVSLLSREIKAEDDMPSYIPLGCLAVTSLDLSRCCPEQFFTGKKYRTRLNQYGKNVWFVRNLYLRNIDFTNHRLDAFPEGVEILDLSGSTLNGADFRPIGECMRHVRLNSCNFDGFAFQNLPTRYMEHLELENAPLAEITQAIREGCLVTNELESVVIRNCAAKTVDWTAFTLHKVPDILLDRCDLSQAAFHPGPNNDFLPVFTFRNCNCSGFDLTRLPAYFRSATDMGRFIQNNHSVNLATFPTDLEHLNLTGTGPLSISLKHLPHTVSRLTLAGHLITDRNLESLPSTVFALDLTNCPLPNQSLASLPDTINNLTLGTDWDVALLTSLPQSVRVLCLQMQNKETNETTIAALKKSNPNLSIALLKKESAEPSDREWLSMLVEQLGD